MYLDLVKFDLCMTLDDSPNCGTHRGFHPVNELNEPFLHTFLFGQEAQFTSGKRHYPKWPTPPPHCICLRTVSTQTQSRAHVSAATLYNVFDMLARLLLAFGLICHASAAALGSEPREIIFQSAQEYALSHEAAFDAQEPVFVTSKSPSGTTYPLRARPTSVWRPRDPTALQHARWRSLHFQESEPVQWEVVETLGPDIEDKHTLSQLARMTGNAYAMPGQKNWYDVDEAWNTVRRL